MKFLPTSKYLNLFWNLGSFLGMILVLQVITGVLLTLFYTNDPINSFFSVDYINREINYGWLIRILHMNGASIFFFLMYLHLLKALFFSSYRLSKVWFSGAFIFIISMATAFMGYVLVWGQMSYWAAVVITSLISVIPMFGTKILLWIWGGFSVGGATLKIFFTLHFLLPWLIIVMVLLHLFFLHSYGSSSCIGYNGVLGKGYFNSYYSLKDFYNFMFFFMFMAFFFINPYMFSDPEMYTEANNLVSPVHIVPEWYFLWVYGILRSFSNKMLGVLLLVLSILLPFLLSLTMSFVSPLTMFNKFLVYNLFFIIFLLSWLGQCPAELPFINFSLLLSFFYFFFIFLIYTNIMVAKKFFKCMI